MLFKVLEYIELWKPKSKVSHHIRKDKQLKEHNQCGTPSCCGECDTATKQEEKK